MNMSRLKRAFKRGNRVVLFDAVSNPTPNLDGEIAYAGALVCADFQGLAAAERYRRKENQVRRSPIGAKAVVVPYLAVLRATKEHPHPVNNLILALQDKPVEQVAAETNLDPSYLHAIRAVYSD